MIFSAFFGLIWQPHPCAGPGETSERNDNALPNQGVKFLETLLAFANLKI
jgi:hypothetical protein